MRRFAIVLLVAMIGMMAASPSEARHHKKRGNKAGCTACTKAKCSCTPEKGYRAAAWGSSWYHTSESCKAVAEIPKDKLITGEQATFGRRRHCCCGHAS